MHRAIRFLLAALGVLTTTAALAQTPAVKPPPEAATAPQDAAAPAPEAGAEETGSLFAPRWNEVTFGGRWTSVSGDEARFDRYQDHRSGLVVDGLRFQRETDAWSLQFGADNVGYRDQRYAGVYERTGLFRISGLWDQVPQFYSTDTKTPYTPIGGTPMGLDDATQLAIQQAQTNTKAYIPQAVQFDLRERRDIGKINARVTPTRAIDFTSSFTTTRHSGELPWGASFGFSNDVEVPLPYDSRTNDFSLGAEWSNDRAMVRVAYDGSCFDNLDDTLVWDSRCGRPTSPAAPGADDALWPSNISQTVSAAGYAKFARRTQVHGFLSWVAEQQRAAPAVHDQQRDRPPTRAAAGQHRRRSPDFLRQRRPGLAAEHGLAIQRAPAPYDYNNETPQAVIPQFINYDTSAKASTTNGPELFAHDRTTFEADATWSGLQPVALTAGYTLNSNGYAHRIFESSDEQVFMLKADAVGNQWMTFRAHYDHFKRTGDGLDEEGLVEICEQPALRHYDVADRNRDSFTGQVDVTPNGAGDD